VTDVAIPALLCELRRVAEHYARLLGKFNRLVNDLEDVTMSGDLREGEQAEDKKDGLLFDDRTLRELSQLAKKLKGVTTDDQQEKERNEDNIQESMKENQLREDPVLRDLRGLLEKLEEVTMPDEQQDQDGNQETSNDIVSSHDDKKSGDYNDLVIKTDGQIEAVVAGWGAEKNLALKLARFRLTPRPGGVTRVKLSAKNETILRALDYLKPAGEQTE
jgi:hypothetical protein